MKQTKETKELNQNYATILKDLEDRHRSVLEVIQDVSRLKDEAKMLSQMIATTKRFLHPSQVVASNGTLAGLSVRWSILYLLAENKSKLKMSDLVAKLQEGGITSSAQNFTGNVAAILSDMNHRRKEVKNVEGVYEVTPDGANAWKSIKKTSKWSLWQEAHKAA